MRSIPGMVVMSPADDVEARAMVKAAYEYVGPVYIRFGRAAVPVFHEEEGYTFEIGKGEVLQDGAAVAIYGEWEGWYVVHYGELVGYAAAAYIETE